MSRPAARAGCGAALAVFVLAVDRMRLSEGVALLALGLSMYFSICR
jgi:hypothetical protein